LGVRVIHGSAAPVNEHVRVFPAPSLEKFNTFNTFNTFDVPLSRLDGLGTEVAVGGEGERCV
jgi:hypothetical protein